MKYSIMKLRKEVNTKIINQNQAQQQLDNFIMKHFETNEGVNIEQMKIYLEKCNRKKLDRECKELLRLFTIYTSDNYQFDKKSFRTLEYYLKIVFYPNLFKKEIEEGKETYKIKNKSGEDEVELFLNSGKRKLLDLEPIEIITYSGIFITAIVMIFLIITNILLWS